MVIMRLDYQIKTPLDKIRFVQEEINAHIAVIKKGFSNIAEFRGIGLDAIAANAKDNTQLIMIIRAAAAHAKFFPAEPHMTLGLNGKKLSITNLM